MVRRDWREITGGALLIAFGLAYFWASFRYGIGSAQRMEPGFFPMSLGAVSMLVGLGIALSGLRRKSTASTGADTLVPAIPWRSIIFVTLGVIAFAALIRPLGILPTIIVSVFIFSAAGRTLQITHTLLLALFISVMLWLVFSLGLGLPISFISQVW